MKKWSGGERSEPLQKHKENFSEYDQEETKLQRKICRRKNKNERALQSRYDVTDVSLSDRRLWSGLCCSGIPEGWKIDTVIQDKKKSPTASIERSDFPIVHWDYSVLLFYRISKQGAIHPLSDITPQRPAGRLIEDLQTYPQAAADFFFYRLRNKKVLPGLFLMRGWWGAVVSSEKKFFCA